MSFMRGLEEIFGDPLAEVRESTAGAEDSLARVAANTDSAKADIRKATETIAKTATVLKWVGIGVGGLLAVGIVYLVVR